MSEEYQQVDFKMNASHCCEYPPYLPRMELGACGRNDERNENEKLKSGGYAWTRTRDTSIMNAVL